MPDEKAKEKPDPGEQQLEWVVRDLRNKRDEFFEEKKKLEGQITGLTAAINIAEAHHHAYLKHNKK